MDTFMISAQDWLAITGALTTALGITMSPAYYYLWQMKESMTKTNIHLAEIGTVVTHCPYCQRREET
jgi:hypothetical protein